MSFPPATSPTNFRAGPLASKQTREVPIKHLYVEYKYWIERQQPFSNITDELTTIARQGADYRRLTEHKTGDPVGSIGAFLDAFDSSMD